MRTVKFCDASTLLDGKEKNEYNEVFVVSQHCCIGRKRISTMKLCGVTILFNRKKYNEALWCYKTVGWEEK